MLKFINKQLSKEELHKVETHMLDCELCTDAYEGMAYAENSSMLFAIDSQIDQRVGIRRNKTPIMRNLMLAASVLVIVFGTYFTFSFFNKTVNNGNSLAINEVVEAEQEPLEEGLAENFEENNQRVVIEKEEMKEEVYEKANRSGLVVAEPILVEQIIEEDEALFLSDAVADEEVEEIEQEELLEAVTTVISGNISNDFNEPEITTKANKYYGYVAPSVDEKGDILSKKAEKQKNRSKSNKKARFKPVGESSSFVENSTEDSDDELRNQNNEKILIIEDYKVINYLEEYQASYDTENEKSVELNSVSAGFESKLDKDLAGKDQQESIV
ncbi:MAG: hypothetical protein HRT73_07670, partial [Flavobacteriales bacterium]|nr:hypothetical protein [Flavobacteriales bacterium]